MNPGENQPRTLAALKKEKRDIEAKLKQLEADDLFLEEKFYEVLSEIQEVLASAPTPPPDQS